MNGNNRIIVTTQKEFDELPSKFEEFVIVEIRSKEKITIIKTPDSSQVVARGSSKVVAWDSSKVVARDSSKVEAWGSSQVVAWDSSKVVARDSSKVEARGSSQVVAWDSSKVVARDSSKVEAWGSSKVVARGLSEITAYMNSYVLVLSSYVFVKKLLDFSIAVFKGVKGRIGEKGENSYVREIPRDTNPSLEEWRRRGYIYADGITKKIKNYKKLKEIEVFECEEFLADSTSFVVKKGEFFSHGKTLKEAKDDLKYKISHRDTSLFKPWRDNPDMKITLDNAIAGYRTVTGACSEGCKQFVKSLGRAPKNLTPKKVAEITKGAFGSEVFSSFIGVRGKE